MSFTPLVPMASRPATPTHRPFVPDDDQESAIRFMVGQYIVAGFCDIGSGKTAITLESYRRLKELGRVETMLVIAPVKVAHEVWPPEVAKWTEFKDFKIVVLHGRDKDKKLKQKADIYVVNYEGLPWLCDKFAGRKLDFDIVVFDELSKMRNARAERHKALRPRLKGVKHRWGLTGTPAPNGYENLFGQMLILDNGAALGPYITHYRDRYFVPSFDGFNYHLKQGADKKIEARIKPYVVRIAAKNLPPVYDVPHVVKLPTKAQQVYNAMKKDMLAALEGEVVTAVNAGAAYSKLLQMANGAVYVGEGAARDVVHLHDAKLDALADIIEELNGQQMLVCYAFRHDLDRLLKKWPNTPYLGGDVTPTKAKEAVRLWNSGKTQLMFIHPASAGHGLNLQLSGAHHICWFGMTWDRELYDQAIGRLVRRGQTAATVYNHLIIVDGSLDVEAVAALHAKDTTQRRLLDRLHSILHSVEEPSAAGIVAQMETEMAGFQKLGRQGDGDDRGGGRDRDRDDDKGGGVPKGWGGRSSDERDEDRGGRGRDDDRGRDDRRDDRDRDRGDDRDRGRSRDDDRDRDRGDDRDRGRSRDDDRDRDRDRRDDDRDRRDDDRGGAPKGWGKGRDEDGDDQKDRVRDKISAREGGDDKEPVNDKRDDRDDGKETPKGWGKPPAEGERPAEEAPKPKRTRTTKAKDDDARPTVDQIHGTQGAGVAPEVIAIAGGRGSASVGGDSHVAELHLNLRLTWGQLARVLTALEKSLGDPF